MFIGNSSGFLAELTICGTSSSQASPIGKSLNVTVARNVYAALEVTSTEVNKNADSVFECLFMAAEAYKLC